MATATRKRAIRVLVVDDHAVVRAGLRALLSEVDEIAVVDEAEDGAQALEKALSSKPDVILMDLVMPVMNGVEAIRGILASNPNARILALTSFSAEDHVFPALEAGAIGYLLKDAEPMELVRSIRRAHRGESCLDPAVARKVLRQAFGPEERRQPLENLTSREREILVQLAQGLTNREIGEKLFLSEATIRTHVSNILAKLHKANRVQAALYALRVGLTTLESDG